MSYADLTSNASQIQSLATEIALNQAEHAPFRDKIPLTDDDRRKIRERYTDIPALFDPYANFPDPGQFGSGVKNMADIMGRLCVDGCKPVAIDGQPTRWIESYDVNPTINNIGTVGPVTISNWNGAAADNFKREFLGNFDRRAHNQFAVAAILKAGLEAQRDMWAAARNDIDKVATSTLDALQNFYSFNATTWNVTFTVLSSVAAASAAVVTGGLAITLAVAAAAAQVVAVTPPPDAQSQPAHTVDDIIGAMRDAVAKIGRQIDDRKHLITTSLQANSDFVVQNRPDFVAPRPAVQDMSKIDSADGLGHP